MIAIPLISGFIIGIALMLSPYNVRSPWRLPFRVLQLAFGILVPLLGWFHQGSWGEACFAALIVIALLLATVYRLGNGSIARNKNA